MAFSKRVKKYWVFALSALIILVVLAVIFLVTSLPARHAKKEVSAYLSYQASEQEYAKLAISENNDIYYYAADGKRYVFPNADVYKSWFGSAQIEKIKQEDINTLYKTALGGSVTLRPGTLLKSATLLDTFVVEKNGNIRPVTDLKILIKYYGNDWEQYIVELPDYYFSLYQIGKPIKTAGDFPEISADITIDKDKGLN
ncbi:MAG: hypothetical protein NTZ49_02165 [Candidatus Parcubacteria bacterium]|nr:hypothetical protein [Candidatus Parcubacteria bacterium]